MTRLNFQNGQGLLRFGRAPVIDKFFYSNSLVVTFVLAAGMAFAVSVMVALYILVVF